MKIEVEMMPENSLPRFDLKARKVVDERTSN